VVEVLPRGILLAGVAGAKDTLVMDPAEPDVLSVSFLVI
jgi:hypothetical protein